MTQINAQHDRRFVHRLRDSMTRSVKWWAEHQAWPATDEIRIDRCRSTCGG